jgi:hypothetical protein
MGGVILSNARLVTGEDGAKLKRVPFAGNVGSGVKFVIVPHKITE